MLRLRKGQLKSSSENFTRPSRVKLRTMLKAKRQEAHDYTDAIFQPLRRKLAKEIHLFESHLNKLIETHSRIESKSQAKIKSLRDLSGKEMQAIQKSFQAKRKKCHKKIERLQIDMVRQFKAQIESLD